MWPIYLLCGAVALFLTLIGVWAFSITADVGVEIGSGGLALGLAAVAILALMAGFIWLARRR